jgi:hypothetical protein
VLTSPPLTLQLRGDSVSFSFEPASPSPVSRVGVRAQRRGDRMDAELTVDAALEAIILNRQ